MNHCRSHMLQFLKIKYLHFHDIKQLKAAFVLTNFAYKRQYTLCGGAWDYYYDSLFFLFICSLSQKHFINNSHGKYELFAIEFIMQLPNHDFRTWFRGSTIRQLHWNSWCCTERFMFIGWSKSIWSYSLWHKINTATYKCHI